MEATKRALNREIAAREAEQAEAKRQAPRASASARKLPNNSWHAEMVDLWCKRRNGWPRGFRAGAIRNLASFMGDVDEDFADVLRESLSSFLPDGWAFVEDPLGGWGSAQLVVCEVWDTSPLPKWKCACYGDLFWVLDELCVELVLEVVDRTETIRRVDITDIAYRCGSELWAEWSQVKWDGEPEPLRLPQPIAVSALTTPEASR